MKFRARDPKSEAVPSLRNKYVFFYEAENLGTLRLECVLLFDISPIAVALCLCVVILIKKNIVLWIRCEK